MNKKLVAYFLTIIISTGSYAVWNLSEQRKISKRMKRFEGFMADFEAFNAKYTGPEKGSNEAVAEFKDIMDRHGI